MMTPDELRSHLKPSVKAKEEPDIIDYFGESIAEAFGSAKRLLDDEEDDEEDEAEQADDFMQALICLSAAKETLKAFAVLDAAKDILNPGSLRDLESLIASIGDLVDQYDLGPDQSGMYESIMSSIDWK